MTRLRLMVKDPSLVNTEQIKSIANVLDIVHVDGQHQIILGPGKAQIADLMQQLLASDQEQTTASSGSPVEVDHNTEKAVVKQSPQVIEQPDTEISAPVVKEQTAQPKTISLADVKSAPVANNQDPMITKLLCRCMG